MNTPEEKKCCCCSAAQPLPQPKVSSLAKVKKTAKMVPSMLLSILIAFFPKCPLCWAVYMSMFGSLGLAQLPYMGWLLPVLLGFLAIHLFMLYKKSAQKGYLPFILSLAGALVILSGRFLFPYEKWLPITGMAFIISGSLLNSFSFSRFQLAMHKQ